MSENKFIRHLQGKDTAKSVLEIKNQNTPTSFADMPNGTSNANDVYSDPRGDAVGVLKGSDNWKLDGQNLVEATTVYGDGRDLTTTYQASGATLWVNSTYTFGSAKRFNPNTKFVLKLCGHSLDSDVDAVVGFSLIITFGNTIITKSFRESIYAFNFCKEFVIDFAESNQSAIKVDTNDTMQVQLLCSDATASAVIYNGMTVFTALQRRVDGDAVASDKKTFDEVVDDVEQLQEDLDDLEEYVDETFVKKAGDTMSGALNIANIASSNTPLLTLTHSSNTTYKWNMAPRYNSTTLSIYPGNTETNGYRFATTGFVPASNNARYLGSASLKWKGIYVGVINNGADLTVPNKTGTLATMGDVELAARSGRMLTDQGKWYAKMYSATTVPTGAEYDGRNYADFSQVDQDDNPIIVIYEGQNGAWVQSETITPPAEYDGYVSITSKIWDIVEQAGQQGGRVLWNHTSKEFTPEPRIVSTNDIEITGDSTVIMPLNPSANQIVNKDYVDNHIPTGNFYHPDLFDWKWADHICNDVQWLRADTWSWQSSAVYQAAFNELFYDIQISTYWYRSGGPAYTKSRTPAAGDAVYLNSDLTTQIGTVEAYDDANDEITVSGDTYTFMSNTYVTPTTETVAGYSVSVYTGHSGRKIVAAADATAVDNIYTATGVAWYYIIDIPNKRFKLPRTKFGVTGLRDNVGKYVPESLPNHRHYMFQNNGQNTDITTTSFVSRNRQTGGDSAYILGQKTDNEEPSYGISGKVSTPSLYQDDAPVQQRATQMYLYFYVGEFTQTALENTAGITAETLNDKVDIGHQVIAFQAPTAGNNYTWYRKYADGWVEQGGLDNGTTQGGSSDKRVNIPIEMADANYYVNCQKTSGWDGSALSIQVGARDTTGFSWSITYSSSAQNRDICWEVKGMAA